MKYLPCFGQKHLRILCLAKHYCLELSFQWPVWLLRGKELGKQFVRSGRVELSKLRNIPKQRARL